MLTKWSLGLYFLCLRGLLHIFSLTLEDKLGQHLKENDEPMVVQEDQAAQQVTEAVCHHARLNCRVKEWDWEVPPLIDHMRQNIASSPEPRRQHHGNKHNR